MIVEMKKGASQEHVDHVIERAKGLGFDVQLNRGTEKVVVAILGTDTGHTSTDIFAVLPGVETVTRVMKPYKLVSREFKAQNTVVSVGNVKIGGHQIVVMAGPCAVESEEQLMETARSVKEAGALILRGGAFKPRTSPFAFQGLGLPGLRMLAKVKAETGMAIITEVVDPKDVEMVAQYSDILQIGTRNMQNFALLKEVGRSQHPALLKRGYAATVAEWLTAADYLLAEGNQKVILCERGIRTFETSARFSLDITSIPVIKDASHLPIIVDPSHAAGHHKLVPDLAKAAIAAGADGLIIEVHPKPEEALVDGLQSLNPIVFSRLMTDLKPIAHALGRYI
jgi:3-deoxy-7-phosphoheptulonate synthase